MTRGPERGLLPRGRGAGREFAVLIAGIGGAALLAGLPWIAAALAFAAAAAVWRVSQPDGLRVGGDAPGPDDDDLRVLRTRVGLYHRLPPALQARYEQRFAAALRAIDVRALNAETGRTAPADRLCRALVAAAAAGVSLGRAEMPLPAKVWIYPTGFGWDSVARPDGPLSGMVENSDSVLFERAALLRGFGRVGGRGNVGYHEFAHLIDPRAHDPWLPMPVGLHRGRHFMEADWRRELRRVYRSRRRRSALDDYATQDPVEFFAVAVETYLTTPNRLRRRHPELYERLHTVLGFEPQRFPKR